jgi:hypothetical protein
MVAPGGLGGAMGNVVNSEDAADARVEIEQVRELAAELAGSYYADRKRHRLPFEDCRGAASALPRIPSVSLQSTRVNSPVNGLMLTDKKKN